MPGPGRRFPKGVSPNPGGRPKGTNKLRTYALSKTRQGRLLVDQAVAVLTGKDSSGKAVLQEVLAKGEVVEIGPTLKDKAEARAWLGDRCFGKGQLVPEPPKNPDDPDDDDDEDDADIEPPSVGGKVIPMQPPEDNA